MLSFYLSKIPNFLNSLLIRHVFKAHYKRITKSFSKKLRHSSCSYQSSANPLLDVLFLTKKGTSIFYSWKYFFPNFINHKVFDIISINLSFVPVLPSLTIMVRTCLRSLTSFQSNIIMCFMIILLSLVASSYGFISFYLIPFVNVLRWLILIFRILSFLYAIEIINGWG